MSIGFIIGIFIYLSDYKKMKQHSNIIYFIATLIMVLSFIGLELTINGKNFIRIFGITFSPCIVAIPLYIIAFSGYIFNYNKNNTIKINLFNIETSINTDLFKISILSIFSILLVNLLSSFENTILLTIIYLVIVTSKILQSNQKIIKNLILLHVFTFILLSVLILGFIISPIKNNITLKQSDAQIENIQQDLLKNAKFIGETDSQAFKNGELIISNESSYTLIYLLGKIGILFSIILITTIVSTSIILIFNTKRIKEQYGRYLIIGLSMLFILESIGNILINITSNSIIDINLPFVTYGAIYFIINCFTFSIILSIYRRKNINLYDKTHNKIIS